jgi:hypothetical protein
MDVPSAACETSSAVELLTPQVTARFYGRMRDVVMVHGS